MVVLGRLAQEEARDVARVLGDRHLGGRSNLGFHASQGVKSRALRTPDDYDSEQQGVSARLEAGGEASSAMQQHTSNYSKCGQSQFGRRKHQFVTWGGRAESSGGDEAVIRIKSVERKAGDRDGRSQQKERHSEC